MYYPKQLPYLFHPAFQNELQYIEYQFEELSEYCMCIWQIKSNRKLTETVELSILPDVCIDLVIDVTNQTIVFSGFSKDTEKLELTEDVDYIGIRMKPGAFYALFQIPADMIMDNMIPFSKIDAHFNMTTIFKLEDSRERIDLLKRYLETKIKQHPNSFLIHYVDALYQNPNDKNVNLLAQKFGYNERQLFRIFKKNYGISPKVLLNIIRLHLCLSLLFDEKKELSDIIHLCGFYDQSHFIKEIKRYTGISPLKLLETYQKNT